MITASCGSSLNSSVICFPLPKKQIILYAASHTEPGSLAVLENVALGYIIILH